MIDVLIIKVQSFHSLSINIWIRNFIDNTHSFSPFDLCKLIKDFSIILIFAYLSVDRNLLINKSCSGVYNRVRKGNQIMQPDRKVGEYAAQCNENNKKGKKSTSKNQSKLSVTLEEQVVYSLILSLNTYSNGVDQSQIKQKHESTKQQAKITKFQMLERNGIKRSDINQIIFSKVRPIPYSNMNEIRMKLRACLGKVYLNRKANQSQVEELQICQRIPAQQLFKESINAYIVLSSLLRQSSIPTPIQEGFYLEYSTMWQEFILNVAKIQSSQEQLKAQQEKLKGQTSLNQAQIVETYKMRMLQIWNEIPHQVLSKHLEVFGLRKGFAQLDEQMMIRHFTSLLVDNKIQQCCTYYEIYCLTRKEYIKEMAQISARLKQYEDEVLIPKITKSDHIFSSHVLSLFKSNTELKERLLNSNELEPPVGVRIIDLIKEDGRKYYNIYMYCLKQHYKSVIYDQKYWWMVEDKLSFNKNFIEWYTQDMVKAIHNKQQSDRLEKIAKQMNGVENVEDLQLSILERNQVIDFEHSIKFNRKPFKWIPNPLYDRDRFDCAELLIEEICPEETQPSTASYLRFEEFGVEEKDIKIIDSIDASFHQMTERLLSHLNKPIGFDTEFRCVSTKYEQQGVSLIQLSTQTHHYIIDFLKLETSPEFNHFIVKLLCNEEYIKVGHTISSDIRYLTLTLHIPENMTIKSFIDITQLFKSLHPQEKFSSLSFLCLKFLNRKLSKYEQRSNWNRRPLKKTQIHYAALDAFACVLIYNKILPEYLELVKNGNIHATKDTSKNKNQVKIKASQVETQLESNKKQEELEDIAETQLESKQVEVTGVIQEVNYFVGDIYRSETLIYHKKYEQLLSTEEPKFLIDNMLKKLSSILRNCGLDAEYIAVRDYQLATAIAEKQNRIILTRDSKFFQRKDNKVPIYLIKERTDSDKMFEEITQFFKIDLSKFKTLSRCVKCNGPELVVIDKGEAMNEVKWKHEEQTQKEFWRCTKCKQIYWEGGQFERAKEKYANLKKA